MFAVAWNLCVGWLQEDRYSIFLWNWNISWIGNQGIWIETRGRFRHHQVAVSEAHSNNVYVLIPIHLFKSQPTRSRSRVFERKSDQPGARLCRSSVFSLYYYSAIRCSDDRFCIVLWKYLMHFPISVTFDAEGNIKPTGVPTFNDVWFEMEKILEQKKARAIGVSNFSVITWVPPQIFPPGLFNKRLNDDAQLGSPAQDSKSSTGREPGRVRWSFCKLWLNCTYSSSRHRIHPYLAQNELKEYCKSKGIVVEAYSPSGSFFGIFVISLRRIWADSIYA